MTANSDGATDGAASGEATSDGTATSEASDDATTDAVLEELFAVVEDRKERLPEESYTASLFTHEKGENAVLEKLGEETTELVLAAKDGNREEVAHESADIVYHLLVLLAMQDMELADLRRELEARR